MNNDRFEAFLLVVFAFVVVAFYGYLLFGGGI